MAKLFSVQITKKADNKLNNPYPIGWINILGPFIVGLYKLLSFIHYQKLKNHFD